MKKLIISLLLLLPVSGWAGGVTLIKGLKFKAEVEGKKREMHNAKEEVKEFISKNLGEKHVEAADKAAHYEPVGGDDVAKFEKEPHIYSDEGLKKFKSIKEFLSAYRGQDADDGSAALKAVKDILNYWKLLLKGKKRRKKGKK